MASQAARKRQIQALQLPRVVRWKHVVEHDYRWWRYVDEEPACGYVDTSYNDAEYPYAVDRPASKRRPVRTSLSRAQMRKRMHAIGVRGPLRPFVDAIVHARQTAYRSTSPLASTPLRFALTEVLGPRAAQRMLRGVREPFLFIDEAWFLMGDPAVTEPLTSLLASHRKYNAGTLDAVQSVEDLAGA